MAAKERTVSELDSKLFVIPENWHKKRCSGATLELNLKLFVTHKNWNQFLYSDFHSSRFLFMMHICNTYKTGEMKSEMLNDRHKFIIKLEACHLLAIPVCF